MRQPSTLLLLILCNILLCTIPAYSAVKGGIEYNIPVDYSKLSEREIEQKANYYFYLSQKLPDGNVNQDMTNALMLYSILQNINPDNLFYCLKSGILYDKLNMDRQAKGYFSKAIGINSSQPESYFYFGEFYYKRKLYRKALKYYNEAYKRGFNKNYDMLYRMGDIYEKFGDTRSALKYLEAASEQSPNSELDSKIKQVRFLDSTNKEYYSDTRIRG